MVSEMGSTVMAAPLISIMETIAIGKAFGMLGDLDFAHWGEDLASITAYLYFLNWKKHKIEKDLANFTDDIISYSWEWINIFLQFRALQNR